MVVLSLRNIHIQIKNERKNAEYPTELLWDILGTGRVESLPGQKILCTIVSKEGAAPRDVGAKMIDTSEGRSLGTIGGGCMEAEVMRRARAMFLEENPAPVLMRVNLTAERASQEGAVCGGVIDVWLEAI